MTEKSDLRSRLVVGERRDGRREFDEDAVRDLVTLSLRPGVSVARTAMDHDVNPNQLRWWITCDAATGCARVWRSWPF
ncbi:transposase [Paraburkholderia edwinii]|jgi:transposase|uniref:transposase n=1 Tax=Paraburkholderia edwinii TaxID=2861782 RepID=UPI001FE34830|nr:transposase [Paraburkholderia edwinii]